MANNLSIKDGSGATKTLATIDLGSDVHAPKHVITDVLGAPLDVATSANQVTTNTSLSTLNTNVGAQADAAATTDTGAFSVVSLTKRQLQKQTAGNASLANLDVDLGAQADAVATTDTGTFSLISLAKRALQNWTTLLARVPSLISSVPNADQTAQPVRLVGQNASGAGFSAVGASVIDAFFVQTPIITGSVAYNQAAGAINVVSSTTVNAEFLARSVNAYRGSMRMRFSLTASQRIVNNNFSVLLADLIGENLTFTINSATSVTISLPGNTFDSTMVGQFIMFGGIVSAAAALPGRYAIASVVTGTSITLTVAGFPASGTGTCTLFGRNYIRHLVTGATATTLNVDAQRNGWATGDTAAVINTTASPGTVIQTELTGREVFFSDALRATSTAPTFVTRASRYENIPDQGVDLYVFLWNFNGSVAPASATTFSLAHLSVENFANVPVYLQGARSLGQQNALPVQIQAGANSIGSIGTVTTVTGVTTVSTVGAVTSGNLGIPGIITDVTSAALTTTTTTAAFTPTYGTSYSVSIPVTAVTGTTPTLDVSVEESDDSGTNWFKVYDFPRITATGIYRSPILPMTGNRVRYVQTVAGTTPSFTRAVNRLQSSYMAQPLRQLVDRSIVLTTLNSTTPSLDTRDCGNRVQMVVNIGAVTTTAPALQLEGSDDNGASWYSIGTPLTAVASSTVQLTVTDLNSALVRARVSTAGVGVTAGYVMVKAHD